MAKKKVAKFNCRTCGDTLEDDGELKWHSYENGKESFFCSEHCCATWFAEEIEFEDMEGD